MLLSGSSAWYCWLLGLNRPIRDRRRSGGHLAVRDRADVVVDGMLWRTAGKSARYAGELLVPVSLDAVRSHLPF